MASFSVQDVVRRYPLTFLTCVAIWILSLAPIGEMELNLENMSLTDKGAHFIMYGGFAMVIWGEWLWRSPSSRRFPSLVWTFAAPVAMSGVLELLQCYATTYRSGEWLDLIANTIGAAAGNVVALLASLLLPQKRQ